MIDEADVFVPADAWPPRHGRNTFIPLLEKLVNDTQGAALLTAAITSAINAMRQPGVVRTPDELQAYLPNLNGIVFAMRVLERQSHLPAATYAAVSTFFAGLEPALREMDRYFADIGLIGIERAVALHQFSLAAAWRGACHAAADAVRDLAHASRDCLPELYDMSAGILRRLLSAAALGESPCLTPDGQPFLPALPQQRRAARRVLDQPATLSIAGDTQRVLVRDLSQNGIGIDQAAHLPVGEIAVVTLATGRRLTGRIVWQKGQRGGIRLAAPLTPNDPLLWG